DLQNLVHAEIALAGGGRADRVGLLGLGDVVGPAIGLVVARHGGYPHLLARPDHAKRDLSAVGDEDLFKHEERISPQRLEEHKELTKRPLSRFESLAEEPENSG